MKKVILFQELIPHYRIAIFNQLAKHFDLTVVYSKGELKGDILFKVIFAKTYTFRWKIHGINIYKLASKFDIVICMFDTGFLDYRLLSILPHKYKLIYWGTGVLFDNNNRYDAGKKRNHPAIINAIKRSDATIFYCDYPVKKYSELGIDFNKMFVANNTVPVLSIPKNITKEYILFVGSLYKDKGVMNLLENYLSAYTVNKNIPNLVIIGEGSELEVIQKFIISSSLVEKVLLLGGIYNEEEIRNFFSKAFACISPNQAGLSVLKSMGYGVPFITSKNAITGGEIFNIENNVNGILFNDLSELKDIILDISANPSKYLELGNNAAEFYKSNRTVDMMVRGFLDAVAYVYDNRVK